MGARFVNGRLSTPPSLILPSEAPRAWIFPFCRGCGGPGAERKHASSGWSGDGVHD